MLVTATCMEIRNTHILVRVIRFQSLLSVVAISMLLCFYNCLLCFGAMLQNSTHYATGRIVFLKLSAMFIRKLKVLKYSS